MLCKFKPADIPLKKKKDVCPPWQWLQCWLAAVQKYTGSTSATTNLWIFRSQIRLMCTSSFAWFKCSWSLLWNNSGTIYFFHCHVPHQYCFAQNTVMLLKESSEFGYLEKFFLSLIKTHLKEKKITRGPQRHFWWTSAVVFPVRSCGFQSRCAVGTK